MSKGPATSAAESAVGSPQGTGSVTGGGAASSASSCHSTQGTASSSAPSHHLARLLGEGRVEGSPSPESSLCPLVIGRICTCLYSSPFLKH